MRIIQAEDRRKRLEILPEILAFENRVHLPGTLDYSSNQQDNRAKEYPYYKKSYQSLTMDEYNIIANARNSIYHTGIGLDIKEALDLLKKYTKTAVKSKWR